MPTAILIARTPAGDPIYTIYDDRTVEFDQPLTAARFIGANAIPAFTAAEIGQMVTVATDGESLEWVDADTGPAGADGADGADGSPGVDGDSAYEVAVANGFGGDETAWLASLVGADGADGAPGADGADGTVNVTPTLGVFVVGNGTEFVGESGATARDSLGLGSAAVENASAFLGSLNNLTDIDDDVECRDSLGLGALSTVTFHTLNLTNLSAGSGEIDNLTVETLTTGYLYIGSEPFQLELAGDATVSNTNSGDVSIAPGSTSYASIDTQRLTINAASANGLATLDGIGKIPTSQLPDAVLGQLDYQGGWNAFTNTPTLSSSTGDKGDYYIVSADGSTDLDGTTDWVTGDWLVFNGSVWQKIDNTDAVQSIAGLLGVITASALRSALGLIIGSTVQAYNAGLASIAALTTTAFGRGLLTVANAAGLRTQAGLGVLAVLDSVDTDQLADAGVTGAKIDTSDRAA